MKAAVLKAFGTPLTIETVPDPVLGTGEVIVDVAATRVIAYSREVLSGERRYVMCLPSVPGPGAIGRVREAGMDSTKLKPGNWVYCDPTVRSRDDAQAPDIILQGLTAGGEAAQKLQRYFRDGAWAEQMRVPTENVTRIGDIEPGDAPKWCAMGNLLVPYGGLSAIGLTAGETVVINGATGGFGSAGVAIALAMGAETVITTGRNAAVLDDLADRFGKRVRPVRMTGDEAEDRARILAAAKVPIDCVLDILPPAASAAQVRAAALTVRPNGRVVLMGGVGMLGGSGLDLPYPWLMRNNITMRGQWMYPRDAALRVAGMIRAGLIDIDLIRTTMFPLERVNEAVEHAAEHAGPFRATVLTP